MRDAAATAHWKRHGWLWLRGFLGEETTRDLVRWTDEIAAWPEVPGKWMRYYERRGGDPAARMLARIENFAPFHQELAALFSSSRLLELLAECAGEPVVLFKDKINFKLPGGAGFAPHQDAPAYVDFGIARRVRGGRTT
ncbi:MAG: phytanoyl-CoA dioxygenase family protein [Deltaproteobacteria bacterium]|nr:MAG: phytanoyl-CoA dioxygenase family protein [Deltaproteobacteria bacterium]